MKKKNINCSPVHNLFPVSRSLFPRLAFSLAEMLIVLFIISLIMAMTAPIISKRAKMHRAAAAGGSSGRLLMAIGLLVAAGLVISFVMRSRRPHSSLITDSMNVPPTPPRKP